MNALSMARQAYASMSAPTRTPKTAEYEAIADVTRRIRAAQQDRLTGFPALARALHDNRRLWTIFATDVADPENALPAQLKARIFYLAEFVDQHSGKVISGSASPEPLVEINTTIMRGLRGAGD